MEPLLLQGAIPSKERPILKFLREVPLRSQIQAKKPSAVLLMEENGESIAPQGLGKIRCSEECPIVLIGAFQREKIRSEHKNLAYRVLSICLESLPTWTVVQCCCSAADFTGGFGFSG